MRRKDSYLISRSSNLQIYPALKIGSSGSKCLKMYIRVFSIIANRSGLSDAHFISHTSFLSKRTNSPSFPPLTQKKKKLIVGFKVIWKKYIICLSSFHIICTYLQIEFEILQVHLRGYRPNLGIAGGQ